MKNKHKRLMAEIQALAVQATETTTLGVWAEWVGHVRWFHLRIERADGSRIYWDQAHFGWGSDAERTATLLEMRRCLRDCLRGEEVAA